MNKKIIFFILITLSFNVYAQTIEKSILGKKVLIPSMGNLVPLCEENRQVVQYLSSVMATPGQSEVITCFFSQGIGNSKLEHAVVVLSLNERGDKDIDQDSFIRIKDRVIFNIKNRLEKFIIESREDSIRKGFSVSNNTKKPEVEITSNQNDYVIFRYDTIAPLKSAGREVEKSNTLAIFRVKNRAISINSYAYEIDAATKNKISKDIEIWINELIRING